MNVSLPSSKIVSAVGSLLDQPAKNLLQAEELYGLLAATAARAVGCWRYAAGRLELSGFLADDVLPQTVQQEFATAVRSVSLQQTQFGIVQAVLAKGPAVNHRAADIEQKPSSSPGWLTRLNCGSSLAVPIFRGTELRGAVAVATEKRIEPEDETWRLLVAIQGALSTN